MRLTGLFKRGAACLCTAAVLLGGVSAFALTPASVDTAAPAEISVTNAVSEAQLRSTLSKFTVTYDSNAQGWQIDSPYEDASMQKSSCGVYPYLFITNDDPTVYISLGMSYFGNKKLDMKSVRIDDETSWLNEWLAAKSVTATFTGKDGSTKTYTLTKDNLQAIRDILNAYDTLLASDASTARVVLRGLVK